MRNKYQGGEVAETGQEDVEEEAEQIGRVEGGCRQVRTSFHCAQRQRQTQT